MHAVAGRQAKKRRVPSCLRSDFAKCYLSRLAALDPDLAWYIGVALKAPEHLRNGFVDLLNDRAVFLVEQAYREAQADFENGGRN